MCYCFALRFSNHLPSWPLIQQSMGFFFFFNRNSHSLYNASFLSEKKKFFQSDLGSHSSIFIWPLANKNNCSNYRDNERIACRFKKTSSLLMTKCERSAGVDHRASEPPDPCCRRSCSHRQQELSLAPPPAFQNNLLLNLENTNTTSNTRAWRGHHLKQPKTEQQKVMVKYETGTLP